MLICRLQNLDAETAGELAGLGSEQDYDKLLDNIHNDVEVAVLRCAVEPVLGDSRRCGYYDVVFADGTGIPALSGYHLQGIESWR